MPKLKAISQPLPLAKMAYERLRDSILHGQLVPGEVYNEMNLAKDLGISRTPVREALLELSAQGLVIFLPRKGVLVKHFTRKDVEEIFELRRVIELAAIEKVAQLRPAGDLSKLKKHLDEQRKAVLNKDLTGFMKADRAFHATFCDLADNRRLFQILENVRDLIHFLGMQGLGAAGRAETVIEEHERVLKAVAQRDAGKARKEMERHLSLSKEVVLQYYDSRNGKGDEGQDSSPRRPMRTR